MLLFFNFSKDTTTYIDWLTLIYIEYIILRIAAEETMPKINLKLCNYTLNFTSVVSTCQQIIFGWEMT